MGRETRQGGAAGARREVCVEAPPPTFAVGGVLGWRLVKLLHALGLLAGWLVGLAVCTTTTVCDLVDLD